MKSCPSSVVMITAIIRYWESFILSDGSSLMIVKIGFKIWVNESKDVSSTWQTSTMIASVTLRRRQGLESRLQYQRYDLWLWREYFTRSVVSFSRFLVNSNVARILFFSLSRSFSRSLSLSLTLSVYLSLSLIVSVTRCPVQCTDLNIWYESLDVCIWSLCRRDIIGHVVIDDTESSYSKLTHDDVVISSNTSRVFLKRELTIGYDEDNLRLVKMIIWIDSWIIHIIFLQRIIS